MGVPPHMWRGSFEGEKRLAQDMPGHFRRWLYSARLGSGQHRYGMDANWGVLDGGANWRNLTNTTELSVYGGDAAV